jgi:regulator of RNase E activity RraA
MASPVKGSIRRLAENSTAVLADAAFKVGKPVRVFPSGMIPLDRNDIMAGPAVTVSCRNDLVAVLEGLMRAQAGDVLLIDNQGFLGAGCIGDVVVTEAVRKGLAGIAVFGCIRDSRRIARLRLPVFSLGVIPVGPLKLGGKEQKPGAVNVPANLNGTSIAPGDVVVGDADGLIALEAQDLEPIIEKAEEIEHQEQALMDQINGGSALDELFALKEYLEKRKADPELSFGAHLTQQGRTI